MIIVMMGVTGSGKSVVGSRVARALACRFIEGDALHSDVSRRKMASGRPLEDADRWPWLDTLAQTLAEVSARGESAVASCSALKRAYRDRLRARCPGIRFVHLVCGEACIAERLSQRRGHYMPASLLPSQLATLESPGADEDVLGVDAERPLDIVVADVTAGVAAAQR